jgi:phosphoheptose isomerase
MKDAREVLTQNIADARAVFEQLAGLETKVQAAAATIAAALLSGRKLLACGNGGSAADAAHFTTEFVGRFDRDRRAFPAISLVSHGGDLTALSNDYSFREVFARQVEAFGVSGDVLLAFTTSGQSENVVRALETANERGLKTIAFLGRHGGKCAGLAEIELLVAGKNTARIQEGHKFLLHTICQLVESELEAGS